MRKGCGTPPPGGGGYQRDGGYPKKRGRLGPNGERLRGNIATDANAEKPSDALGQRRFERFLRSFLLPRLKPVVDRRQDQQGEDGGAD